MEPRNADEAVLEEKSLGEGYTSHQIQAGRPSSSSGAERSSLELQTPSSDAVIQRTSGDSLHRTTSVSTTDNRLLPLSSRRTSYIPTVPSPLNPTAPPSVASSTSSKDEEKLAGGSVSPTESPMSSDFTRSQRPFGRKSSKISPPQAILRQKSASIHRPPTPESPKRLKDLGRDYTRYPSNQDYRFDVKSFASRSSTTPTAVNSLLRTTTNNTFSDSQADLEKFGYPDDSIAAFHPYHGGEKGFVLYADEIEADDNMHMPREDDDIVYKPKLSEYFNRRQIISTVGGIILLLGLVCVFIVLPVLTFTTHLLVPSNGNGPV